MKKSTLLISILFSVGMMTFTLETLASRPTDINYVAKKVTTFGSEYREYAVRCSDGNAKTITAWEQRTKWCIGLTNQCLANQLEAATTACGG